MRYMFLPYLRYFDFWGRSGRKEYWLFFLLEFIVFGGAVLLWIGFTSLAALATGDFSGAERNWPNAGVGLAVIAWMLATIIPIFSVTFRRLHDLGLSGWWFIASLIAGMIPYLGVVVTIAFYVVLALPGNQGSNRFGSEPE